MNNTLDLHLFVAPVLDEVDFALIGVIYGAYPMKACSSAHLHLSIMKYHALNAH